MKFHVFCGYRRFTVVLTRGKTLVLILSQMNQVNILQHDSIKIYVNIVLSPMPSLPSCFSLQVLRLKYVYIYRLFLAYFIARSSFSPGTDHPNIWRRTHISKFPIILFSSTRLNISQLNHNNYSNDWCKPLCKDISNYSYNTKYYSYSLFLTFFAFTYINAPSGIRTNSPSVRTVQHHKHILTRENIIY
jgi:hypothetical protein